MHCVYRPASEALDDGMVSIKVPARHPTGQPDRARLFYFGTISRSQNEGTASSVPGLRTPSMDEEDATRPPIPGVKLGPLLGRGSFGSVYYGTWNGAQIAVKVSLVSSLLVIQPNLIVFLLHCYA